ncbi:MAG: hypothetical protein GC159_22005 [Phycisphaera sp.]|nr:hypothetical protein [Phycisphaera sp.]
MLQMLAWPGIVVFVLFVLVAMGVSPLIRRDDQLGAATLYGLVFGGLALSWPIAALIFLVARRSRVVATTVFSVVLLAVTSGMILIAIDTHNKNVSAWDDFDALVARTRTHDAALARRSMAGESTAAERTKALNRFADEAEEVAARMYGRDANAVRVMAEFLRDVNDTGSSYVEASTRFVRAGASAPQTLNSLEEIDQRIAWCQSAIEANERLSEFARTSDHRFKQRLIEDGFSDREADLMLKEMNVGTHPELVQKIRASDGKVLAIHLDLLKLYRGTFGTWRISTIGMIFQDADDYARFKALDKQIRSEIAAGDAFHKELNDYHLAN